MTQSKFDINNKKISNNKKLLFSKTIKRTLANGNQRWRWGA